MVLDAAEEVEVDSGRSKQQVVETEVEEGVGQLQEEGSSNQTVFRKAESAEGVWDLPQLHWILHPRPPLKPHTNKNQVGLDALNVGKRKK